MNTADFAALTAPFLRLLVAVLIFTVPGAALSATPTPKPKLVVVLVIDQLRADYLTRFASRFLPAVSKGGKLGGFEYLKARGAYWPFAEYDYLQCMTGPGHASISTGAYPYQFGIPANYWFDHEKKQPVYCTEDAEFATVGTDKAKPRAGTSPRMLIGTTFGDELKNAGYPSKIVSIALKDRAAILMGGHRADLAVWFDGGSFKWVSSRYYLPDGKLPAWVEALNAEFTRRKDEKIVWNVEKGKPTGLTEDKPVILEKDNSNASIGREFPHWGTIGSPTALNLPYGLEITVDAAEKALDAFKLGRGAATDILFVSFSSHDYTGHGFGPNSREMEEFTVADDRAVSRLLNIINAKVDGGLAKTLIVLTGDHGSPSSAEYLTQNKVPAGRIDDKAIKDKLETFLTNRFGKTKEPWIGAVIDLGYFFNPAAIREKKLEKSTVEDAAKELLAAQAGVAQVLGSTDLSRGSVSPGMIQRQFAKTYYPGRSADVIAYPKPYFMNPHATVDHLTGYAYDRTVPLVIAGPGVRAGRYSQKAEVIDAAPTLAFLLGILRPALSEGRVLSEAIEPR